MISPRVSAVVLAYQGRGLIERCLATLLAQDLAKGELEIIVWDNGSSDGSADVASERLSASPIPHRVSRSLDNLGFAAGCNRGIALASAPYLLLVNQDVELEADYASKLLSEMERRPALGAVQGAILRADRVTVDSLGQYPSYARRCVERGAGRPLGTRAPVMDSFSVCAAAAMYRRSALERVALSAGPFCEGFFAYYEDLDLGWRLRRAGFEAAVVTSACATHLRGGSAAPAGPGVLGSRMLARLSPDLRGRVLRNRWLTALSNESLFSLAWHLPGLVAWEAALYLFLIARDRVTLWRHARGLPATVAEGMKRRRGRAAPRRRSIAIVITKLELGGAQQVALGVARHLSERGARVVFVTGAEGLLVSECEAIPGLVRYFLPDLVREIAPWRDLRAARSLARIFRREGVILVHTHSSKAGILGRLAARRAGVPHVVHTIHGFGWNDFQPWPVRAALVFLERLAAAVTSRFVVVSRENLERGARHGVLDPERTVLIRAGIDLDRFVHAGGDREASRRSLGVAPDGFLIGSVACLKPQKAPLDLVAVASRVCRDLPRATFVLVGDGELRRKVEEAITAQDLKGRFHLLGWRNDVEKLMHAFDLFVLTSLWEGLPMVLPQARAAGLAIVATDVNGNREAVADGVHGRLCPPRDVESIAAACRELLADETRRRAIEARTRDGIEEFSEGEMLQRHTRLYQELAGDELTFEVAG